MKKHKAAIMKLGSLFATFALTLGVASAGSFCMIIFHQPEVPQGMSKFRKN